LLPYFDILCYTPKPAQPVSTYFILTTVRSRSATKASSCFRSAPAHPVPSRLRSHPEQPRGWCTHLPASLLSSRGSCGSTGGVQHTYCESEADDGQSRQRIFDYERATSTNHRLSLCHAGIVVRALGLPGTPVEGLTVSCGRSMGRAGLNSREESFSRKHGCGGSCGGAAVM
jgi:hypothetical protein